MVSTMRGSRRMFSENPWGSLPHCDFRWETLCGQQTLLVTEGGRQDLKAHSLTGDSTHAARVKGQIRGHSNRDGHQLP